IADEEGVGTIVDDDSATLTGTVFEDLDSDGVHDAGEPGIAGWTMYLVGDTGTGGHIERFTTTNADGSFAFDDVDPGDYVVSEETRTGWTQTWPMTNGGTYVFTIVSGEPQHGLNFGNTIASSVIGFKWDDVDGDGEWDFVDVDDSGGWSVGDTGEQPMTGWVIFRDDNDNGILDAGEQSDVTDPYGRYVIGGLVPGDYIIREVNKPGWLQTAPYVGMPRHDGLSANATIGDGAYYVTLYGSEVVPNANFGNVMDYLQTLFGFFNAPLFATFILGMFWKRMTPTAGWAGLVA
ncbi:MAG: hypothetical protein GY700_03780, partial [Propionibacteriaceae bacterium]|nr:hypothetical protein [Propionibacteriaceae bacterium]